jgi:hypothetical protein
VYVCRIEQVLGSNFNVPFGLQTATISSSYAGQQVTDAVEKDIFGGKVFRKSLPALIMLILKFPFSRYHAGKQGI